MSEGGGSSVERGGIFLDDRRGTCCFSVVIPLLRLYDWSGLEGLQLSYVSWVSGKIGAGQFLWLDA
eukprot:scaffold7116_cov30-Attheya_sp.AAC.1